MPPGDRQRSVRSDRSVMLGVLCTACYSRACVLCIYLYIYICICVRVCYTPLYIYMFHAYTHTFADRRANFRKAPRGVRHTTVPALSGVSTPQNALGRGTDSRNVVYDFHHDRAIFDLFNGRRCGRFERSRRAQCAQLRFSPQGKKKDQLQSCSFARLIFLKERVLPFAQF